MDCINCHKEATLTDVFGKVEIYLCEYCGEKFSVRRNGKASTKEMNRVQRDQLQGYLDNQKGIEPTQKTINRMISKKKYNVRMYNPIRDRNTEGPGAIRARG